MKPSEIKFGNIYKSTLSSDEDVYAYVRGIEGGKVGFSVLDEATRSPDFTNCGVFWVREKDFTKVFSTYR
ncbi:MAG: hypothetical protein MR991_08460 [Clostridiales bacterium]|nr:hypothetical protein [Clostridiales bacterium]MDD7035329.1 hypothetical protein [Bacillota bacterium]MDY2920564.1 hypothetical protein [Lentihominibacter sp.]